MNEREVFDKLINVLVDNNLKLGRDYIIKEYHHGCFTIHFCPRRYAVLDIQYIYDQIPDIKVFRIKQFRDEMVAVIKIKIR